MTDTIVSAAVAPAIPAPEPAKTAGETLYPAPVAEAPAAAPEPASAPAAEAAPAEPKAEAAPVEPAPEPAPALAAADYKIELPEGMAADEPTLNSFREFAATNKFTQDQVNGLMAMQVATVEAAKTAGINAWTAKTEGWKTQTMALPEFAPDRREQSLAVIGRMMDEFGSPEAREALGVTGAGNHPAIAKFILSVAQAMVEGEPTPLGRPPATTGRKTLGEIMYPTKS